MINKRWRDNVEITESVNNEYDIFSTKIEIFYSHISDYEEVILYCFQDKMLKVSSVKLVTCNRCDKLNAFYKHINSWLLNATMFTAYPINCTLFSKATLPILFCLLNNLFNPAFFYNLKLKKVISALPNVKYVEKFHGSPQTWHLYCLHWLGCTLHTYI